MLGFGFGLRFLYLQEGRKSIRHLCLCLSVSVSLCLSFEVPISFRENEKSVAKSLSHVAIRVGFAQGAGTGVFAVRDIAISDLIHTADPVVASSSTCLSAKGLFNLFTITSPCWSVITHTSCDVVGFTV